MDIKTFTTKSNNYEINGRIHMPAHYPAPCIICSHGLFGHKGSVKFISLAQHLAKQGFVGVRFDHRGCGESQGQLGKTTLTSRLEDLQAVYNYISRKPEYSNGRIGLMGSSLGGLVSLWGAATGQNCEAVVTWATPWQIKQPRRTVESGVAILENNFYVDLERYDTLGILGRLRRCLILHGENDELVPVSQAFDIYKKLSDPKNIKIIPGADHRFLKQEDRLQAIELTSEFFRYHLM